MSVCSAPLTHLNLYRSNVSISGVRFRPECGIFFRFRNYPPLLTGEGNSQTSASQKLSTLPTATGSNLREEDTDDMFDELFNKHGEVVYRSTDLKKSARSEFDDDAESLSFAVAMAKMASDVKGGDIRVLFVKPLVYWTRFFIIVTAFSRPQVDAMGSRMRDMAEKQYGRRATGDSKPNSWTLLDFGDVVVHIFLPPQRAFYNLEEFYGNATLIPVALDDQKRPFHKS